MKHKVLEFNVILQKEDEGGYSIWVPSLQGCASQGETFEDAVKNIKEAIQLYLEDAPEEEIVDPKSQFMVPIQI